MYQYLEQVKQMTNLEGDEQNEFINNYVNLAIMAMYEMGISRKFLNSQDAISIISMYISNVIDDGVLSTTTNSILQSLRINHPHDEDKVNV